ncbi:MAG: adenylate/guanylate cyclase domain-containing protein [Gammaproteobacteria bacterium]|nr:adenylate/guanylate cyclase domain-containing protein [Gammaproteobacteria bacterium]
MPTLLGFAALSPTYDASAHHYEGARQVLQEYLRRHWVRALVSLLILSFFLVHTLKWHEWELISRFDNIAYDLRLLLTMPDTPDDRIVIVEVDEKSLAAEGRWPWPRDKVARLVDQLVDHYGVTLVAFDVVFAEPEEASALVLLDELEGAAVNDPVLQSRYAQLRPRFDHDHALVESLDGRNVILGAFFTDESSSGGSQTVGELPRPLFPRGSFTGRGIPFVSGSGYAANLAEFQAKAFATGHLMALPDIDGLIRRVAMIVEYDGNYYESLSMAVVRNVLGVESVAPGYPDVSRPGSEYSGLEWLEIGETRVPVDARVSALVPFRGRKGSFPYVSATDVIAGTAPPAVLEGRIALVGATAAGLLDLRATPVQADYPGVEIHANLIVGILDGTVKENPAYALGAEFLLALVSGLLMALLLPVLSPIWAGAMTLVLLGSVVAVNMLVWHYGNFVFPLAASVLMILALFLFNMWYAYFFEARGKRQLAGLFGEYVPPELVEEMSQHPDSFTLESQSRELTVLFSDVRDFTSISEGLGAAELSELMNEYLTAMTRVIYDHRGTVDKYIGDAIMAFWGAPIHDRDHAHNALYAALRMVAQVRVLSKQFRERGWPELRIGIGINTGDMNVGNMGSRYRRAYTVMGDGVNLGSRLEGLTKSYGVSIIVSRETRDAVPELGYRELDRVRVKGRNKPVSIYEPLGPWDALEDKVHDELEFYREAVKLYRAQNWELAELQFVNLIKRSPKRALYKLYIERINHFRESPPPADWDGVYTHLEK